MTRSLRVHVALTPSEFASADLAGRAALVVDVLRATTTVVAACAARCRQVIPVAEVATALARARELPPGTALVAGERGGEPPPGFDLGNSPLEYTAERVAGRTLILTTTNGTAAMLAASAAAAAGVAALTNVAAAARWALDQERDLTILCSGEKGGFSLEDAVCAGLVVGRLVSDGVSVHPSDAALATWRLGEYYLSGIERLAEDSAHARKLTLAGRGADVAACLALATVDEVPVFTGGVIVPAGAADIQLGAIRRRTTPPSRDAAPR
jgi:2-phosphosulfolactate phosphatase